MSSFVSGKFGTFATREDVEKLKGGDLVLLHNEITGHKVARFGDRKAGLKRTVEALERHLRGEPPAAARPVAARPAKGSQTPPKEARKGGRKKAAAAAQGEGEGRSFRPDSNRGKIITLSSRPEGAKLSALVRSTGWEEAAVRAALARIKAYNGLTVEITGEGGDTHVQITGELRTRKAFSFEPKAEIKPATPGSKREVVRDMLLKGATFDEIKKKVGWDQRTTYEGIRLIHGYLGYGMRQEGDKIYAFAGNAKMVERVRPQPKPKAAKKKAAKEVASAA